MDDPPLLVHQLVHVRDAKLPMTLGAVVHEPHSVALDRDETDQIGTRDRLEHLDRARSAASNSAAACLMRGWIVDQPNNVDPPNGPVSETSSRCANSSSYPELSPATNCACRLVRVTMSLIKSSPTTTECSNHPRKRSGDHADVARTRGAALPAGRGASERGRPTIPGDPNQRTPNVVACRSARERGIEVRSSIDERGHLEETRPIGTRWHHAQSRRLRA
jgi:hypothetical protein